MIDLYYVILLLYPGWIRAFLLKLFTDKILDKYLELHQ